MARFAEGLYAIQVSDWGIGVYRNGNPNFWYDVKITARVLNEDDPSQNEPIPEGEQETRRITRAFKGSSPANTKSVLKWLVNDMKHLGVEVDELRRLDPTEEDAYDLMGRTGIAECKHKVVVNEETGESRTYEEWRIYAGARPKPERPDKNVLDAVLTMAQDILDTANQS